MKTVLVLVFAVIAVANAYPRATREEAKEDGDSSEDTELYIVPLKKTTTVLRPSFGFGLPEDLVPPPFEQHPLFAADPWGVAPAGHDEQVDDFMSQMQQMLKEMRKQLTDLIHRSHSEAGAGFAPEEGSVDTKISEGDLPQNKSTSTTKVIDGHVVTVNETTYSSGDDNIGAVFRIKVVEVHRSDTPDTENKSSESEDKPEGEEPSTTEAKAPAESEPEPTTGKSELEEEKHEETNEIPNNWKVPYEWSSEVDPSSNEIDQPEVFSVDEFSPIKKESYYDLSSDTKVNDYMSDHQGLVMMEPDAEMIDVSPDSYYHYNRMPERLQRVP